MKKLLSLILIAALSSMLTACLEIEKKRDRREMLDISEPVNMGDRAIDISEGIIDGGAGFSYSCDLDYDGKTEKISINVSADEDYGGVIEVSVGDKRAEFECLGGYIEKVYSCDIDDSDDSRDIAIITNEASDDPRIRILSYKKDLSSYKFSNNDAYLPESESDCNWLGYTSRYYFKVNDDNTIMLEEQTNSNGMWSVLRKYERNKDGVFEEITFESYNILENFMNSREPYGENVTEEEKDMWKRGYIKAYMSYSNESISLGLGEYFKPVYDDDNDRVYIKKENGETGYLDIGYNSSLNSAALNPSYFFLAG